jgi:hypothetical protein
VRGCERELELNELAPREALRERVGLTFDFLVDDPYFVRIIMNENLMEGRFAARSDLIPLTSKPLLETLSDTLRRGHAQGIFEKFDAVEGYVAILSLCFVHVSNRYTLGAMFQRDLSSPRAVKNRRKIVIDAVTAMVTQIADD